MAVKTQCDIVKIVTGPLSVEIASLLKFPVPNHLLKMYCTSKLTATNAKVNPH